MKKNKGFTLIELLIVLAITAVLTTISIIYSHIGQNQISLSVESSKVGQLILEAKQLSIATYSTNGTTCAYGVQFDYVAQEYSLFAYNAKPVGGTCPSLVSSTDPNKIDTDAIQMYQSGSWHVHVAPGVKLVNPTTPASETITDVLFYPPDPFTLVNVNGSGEFIDSYTSPQLPSTNVYLETVNGDTERVVTVSPEGQVNL
jgi:prepilin-type N-terminal cleavage/methylation domain-containing protein